MQLLWVLIIIGYGDSMAVDTRLQFQTEAPCQAAAAAVVAVNKGTFPRLNAICVRDVHAQIERITP